MRCRTQLTYFRAPLLGRGKILLIHDFPMFKMYNVNLFLQPFSTYRRNRVRFCFVSWQPYSTYRRNHVRFCFVSGQPYSTYRRNRVRFCFVLHGNLTRSTQTFMATYTLGHFWFVTWKSSLLFSCNPILWLQPYIELGTSGPFCLGASTFEVHGVHPRQVYIDAIKPVFFNAAWGDVEVKESLAHDHPSSS